MTNELSNEEAIKAIDEIKRKTDVFDDLYLALDMAIEALKNQKYVIKEAYINGYDYGVKDWFKAKTEPCEDCISREEVDNYIAKLMSGYLYEEERRRLEDFSIFIGELPSVIPSRSVKEWLDTFDTESATTCFTAVQILKEKVYENKTT